MLCALLWGCGTKPQPLPVGLVTATGTVVRQELSLERRGTHALLQADGTVLYDLESSLLGLRDLEGLVVGVQGRLEHNILPEDPPVMLVEHVALAGQSTTKETLQEYGLQFDRPAAWVRGMSGTTIVFFDAATSIPLLTVATWSGPVPDSAAAIRVAGRSAQLVIDDSTGQYRLFVPRASGMLILSYSPDASIDSAQRRGQWITLLQSLSFSGSAGTVSSRSSTTGTVSSAASAPTGTACGGPAGLLCPAGSYCMISDSTLGIGTCTQVK